MTWNSPKACFVCDGCGVQDLCAARCGRAASMVRFDRMYAVPMPEEGTVLTRVSLIPETRYAELLEAEQEAKRCAEDIKDLSAEVDRRGGQIRHLTEKLAAADSALEHSEEKRGVQAKSIHALQSEVTRFRSGNYAVDDTLIFKGAAFAVRGWSIAPVGAFDVRVLHAHLIPADIEDLPKRPDVKRVEEDRDRAVALVEHIEGACESASKFSAYVPVHAILSMIQKAKR